jgi:hypothetical protein
MPWCTTKYAALDIGDIKFGRMFDEGRDSAVGVGV